LIHGRKTEGKDPGELLTTHPQEPLVHIVLIRRSFGGNRKANLGLIAEEVARTFSSNDIATQQILQSLSDPEVKIFRRMEMEQRASWLIKKWGFQDELDALRKEMAALEMNKED
jgi:hypothetical protein